MENLTFPHKVVFNSNTVSHTQKENRSDPVLLLFYKNMEIVTRKIDEIKPYKNNPRKNDDAVDLVAHSIREFGFKVPIVIDRDGIVVAGDTRLKAAKKLHMSEVMCVVADDLTDEQVKAFRLADNKVAEAADWDMELLESELIDIVDIDMADFGFDLPEIEEDEGPQEERDDNDGYYGDARERTNTIYNMLLSDYVKTTDDFWQMPIIEPEDTVPDDIVGFNYAITNKDKDVGIHFYIDDYQFERVWNYPDKYIDVLMPYQCVFSPDFSLYTDMPMPMKIWNVYRSRQMGAFWQSQGIKVIPTVTWCEEETFDFCFRGLPKNSTLSISTIGVKRDPAAFTLFSKGVAEMLTQLTPQRLLVYGGEVDCDYGDADVIYYGNHVLERWNNGR